VTGVASRQVFRSGILSCSVLLMGETAFWPHSLRLVIGYNYMGEKDGSLFKCVIAHYFRL